MARRKSDVLQGTLDLLILKTLALESMHGWGISKRIESASKSVLQINQGSLYPALYRLQDKGLITSEVGVSPDGRPVRTYSLTDAGRKQFATEQEVWTRLSTAVEDVLGTT